MSRNDFDREVTYDIVENIGVVTTHSTGWSKELNLVSWNGAAPKYDIRDWSPDHDRMSRGITLTEQEMRRICDFLRKRGRKKYVSGDDSDGADIDDIAMAGEISAEAGTDGAEAGA